MLLRLQHFLARAGVASRRQAETLITAGRVSVNGKRVRELGTKVDSKRDLVHFDGRRLALEEQLWLLLNKPDATVTTARDPEGRRTVLDVLGKQPVRLYPVGRLDYHTTGVLLLTNDGELAATLTHPRHEIPRVYQAKIKAAIGDEALATLRSGVRLPGVGNVTAEVARLSSTGKHVWIGMTIRQGSHHQIHRMLEQVGATVLKLHRVAFAGLTAEGLRPGAFRPLSEREINHLRRLAAPVPPATPRRPRSARPARR